MTHAALAILSDCYSPRKGRLSTCYSPVRRFTRELPLFLARLACVKPAANVRSEPGSNSPIKVFDLLIESPVRLPQRKTQSSGVLLFVARFPLYSVFKDRLAPARRLEKVESEREAIPAHQCRSEWLSSPALAARQFPFLLFLRKKNIPVGNAAEEFFCGAQGAGEQQHASLSRGSLRLCWRFACLRLREAAPRRRRAWRRA